MVKYNVNHTVTRHHIIGKSLHDDYKVHQEQNIIKITEATHRALHILFKNELRPKEQLERFYFYISRVMSEKAKELFEALFTMQDDDFYHPNMIYKWEKR